MSGKPGTTSCKRRFLSTAIHILAWIEGGVLIGWVAYSYALPEYLRDSNHAYALAAVVAFFGRTFTFHIGLLLGLLALLSWGTKHRRLALLCLIVAVACLAPAVWSLRPRQPIALTGNPCRIMSMNTKFKDIDFASALAQIRKQNPDMIAVEDLTGIAFETLQKAIGKQYPHRVMRGGGLALYSRLPFITRPRATVNHLQRQLRVVVNIDGKPVAIYVVHTYSPRSVNRIIRTRIATADLLGDVHGETLPTVMIGDFNFTSSSANAAAVRSADFTDAFEAVGYGRGSTWPKRPRWLAWVPGVRIDHAYLSPGVVCGRFEVGRYIGSDHLPIICDVGFAAGMRRNETK